MNILEDTMLVYRIAKYYYIDGYGQKEIAKMTGISRPQISRLIKQSQELGIVKIEVSLPEIINIADLQQELASCLGIDSCVVIPSERPSEIDNFFPLAAEQLEICLKGYRNIGIGWGHSLYEISRNISYQDGRSDVIFYPLIGCSGSINPYLQVGSITDRFAERYRARAYYLNLPVYLREASLSKDEMNKWMAFQKKWEQLDVAVVGIGTLGMKDPVYIDEVSNDPYLLKWKKDIEGDVLGYMMLKDGGLLTIPGFHHIACPIDVLKRISRVIGVAKGINKVEAICRAATNKYINTLITDEDTAKAIIRLMAK